VLAPPRTTRPGLRFVGQLALALCLVLATYPLSESISSTGLQPYGELEMEPQQRPRAVEAASELAGDGQPAPEEPPAISAVEVVEPKLGELLVSPQPSSAFIDPGQRRVPAGESREVATVPIVMYHHVDDLPKTASDPHLRELTVPVTTFRRQLEFLQSMQASTVSLADVMDYLDGGEALPPRAVVLTFDDGYDDNYRFAYPLLRQFEMTGTFFVVAGLVGKRGYMTWEQLREMQLHGMAIESHSLDHVDLSLLPRAELQRQLTESRRVLERNLLAPVRYLNYPSGRYSRQVIAAARSAGYEAAVTTQPGLVQERGGRFELSRIRVSGNDTPQSFAAKMTPTFWKYPPRGQFAR
jgi:peptidoglycan/xylan/chitin deacetylase (PgdA/CDA1 family)